MKFYFLSLVSMSILFSSCLKAAPSELEKFASALERIAGPGGHGTQMPSNEPSLNIPRFENKRNSCWFNAATQIALNIPAVRQLFLNEPSLRNIRFFKEFVQLVQAVVAPHDRTYNFDAEMVAAHRAASPFLTDEEKQPMRYGKMADSPEFAQMLLGADLPLQGIPPLWPRGNEVLPLVRDFVFNLTVPSFEPINRFVYTVPNLQPRLVNISGGVEGVDVDLRRYITLLYGQEQAGTSAYYLPPVLRLQKGNVTRNYELIGLIVHVPGHYWAIIKDQYNEPNEWYIANDVSGYRKATSLNEVLNWPQNGAHVRLTLYKLVQQLPQVSPIVPQTQPVRQTPPVKKSDSYWNRFVNFFFGR